MGLSPFAQTDISFAMLIRFASRAMSFSFFSESVILFALASSDAVSLPFSGMFVGA